MVRPPLVDRGKEIEQSRADALSRPGDGAAPSSTGDHVLGHQECHRVAGAAVDDRELGRFTLGAEMDQFVGWPKPGLLQDGAFPPGVGRGP